MKRKLVENKCKEILIIDEEFTQEEIDLIYTDSILLTDALFDHRYRESDVLDDENKEALIRVSFGELNTDPEEFKKSLDYAIQHKEHGDYLIKRSLSSLKKMKTYKIEGMNAGFALKQMKGSSDYSEIVAVHNASKYKEIGIPLVRRARELGGKYLECFGKKLEGFYIHLGFEMYGKKENVWVNSEGKAETLYFMKHKDAPLPKIKGKQFKEEEQKSSTVDKFIGQTFNEENNEA